MQVKKLQLESKMEQRAGFKLGKAYAKTVCCHLAYLTYMQSTSCEMLDLMNHNPVCDESQTGIKVAG